ncbi:MAG: methyltransferase type 12 [Candidatus Riflebacteria bacterium]|nr:methyltransferase type 12 [Candidatus Riflebacteria bacterium]
MTDSNSQLFPELFLEAACSYQRTAALKAAIDLELFTSISRKGSTVLDISEKCRASERGIRILCDYLTVDGFLIKVNDFYYLTPSSAMFLNQEFPTYVGGELRFLNSQTLMGAFKHLAEAVRVGETVLPDDGVITECHPIWEEFALSMVPMMQRPANLIAKLLQFDTEGKIKVLDLAARHGIFGITLARHYPNVEVVAMDWPNVLSITTDNAIKMGVSNRFSTIPGNPFDEDFGVGYDLVILADYLHQFDILACEKLLKKVNAALVKDGRVVIIDFVVNEDRISPPAQAKLNLSLLASTPNGDIHTIWEFEKMLKNSNFHRTESNSLPPGLYQMILSYKS